MKIAIDAVELNRQIVRKTMQMRILAELPHQISMKISEGRGKPLYLLTIDLKYAFGQIPLHRETAKHVLRQSLEERQRNATVLKKGSMDWSTCPWCSSRKWTGF